MLLKTYFIVSVFQEFLYVFPYFSIFPTSTLLQFPVFFSSVKSYVLEEGGYLNKLSFVDPLISGQLPGLAVTEPIPISPFSRLSVHFN